MLRSTFVGLVTLGLMVGPAAAQGKMDCGSTYKGFWDKFQQEKAGSMTPDQLANVSRLALRAYDACQAGDEFNARKLFDDLAKTAT